MLTHRVDLRPHSQVWCCGLPGSLIPHEVQEPELLAVITFMPSLLLALLGVLA
jgi:hypothetical protein